MLTASLNIVDIKIAQVMLRGDDIVQINFEDDIIVDVQDVINIDEAVDQVSSGIKRKLLVVTGKRNDSTMEARKMTAVVQRKNDRAVAEALVVTSFPTRIALNFFYKIYTPSHPYKTFKTIHEAEDWLADFN